ncbi:MAG: iron-containing alcohol dehydrogenase [bacterium]
MAMHFSYFMPTRIIFGPGSLKELATTPYLPGRRALIVIGASGVMRKKGYLKKVLGLLKQNGVGAVVYDKIQPNPVSDHVDEGATIARENHCTFILGLGGGSTIDSAKSIGVMVENPGKYWDYIEGGSGGGKEPVNGSTPVVAIPTTAGTGTEADPWTVITKSGAPEKIGWGKECTFPVVSIVDPELMLSVPRDVTAHTGMDALFHAVEAYLATCNQPASDHLALEAVQLITKYLPVAVQNGRNIEARTKLAWASTEAGICESLSGCISHHSIEHAVSAYYPDIAHGAGLTMLSVSYFTHLARKAPGRFEDLAAAMGERVDHLPKKERPAAFIRALKKLIKKIGLKDESLSKHGVKREDLRLIATNSFYTMGGLYKVTPAKLSVNDVVSILEGAYE